MQRKPFLELHIPIEPAPKERPYFSGKHVFTRATTKGAEESIGFYVKTHMQLHGIIKTDNFLYVDSLFCFYPRVVKKRKKKGALYPKRPDLDNLQ